MCSQYTVRTSSKAILDNISELPDPQLNFDSRFLPHSEAPVIVQAKEGVKITPMKFSLIPGWSKEPRVKFATHNARVETVLEKPTWKKPFVANHCVIPMTGFYEAVYTGPLKGNVIEFKPNEDAVLYAAGIFDYWSEPASDKGFYSFSIVTRDPSEFISNHGHDRTPLFIPKDYVQHWLSLKSNDGEAMRADLIAHAYHPGLDVAIDRALKPGWEKRIPKD